MPLQAPHSLIMVRPHSFGFNPETAVSNVFQKEITGENISQKAVKEFDAAVKILKKAGIDVIVFNDTAEPPTPDAIFPNNWFIALPEGKIILCPMASPKRRLERRLDIIEELKKNYSISEVIDLSPFELENRFLEGTGSIVFDHIHKKAYACPSERTDEKLFLQLCNQISYTPIVFTSRDESGKAIYHTNVLMSIGTGYAIVCLDAVHPADHEVVLESLADDDIKVISISYKQMRAMAGNVFEVQTNGFENVLVMSETAFNSLLPGQVDGLSRQVEILTVAIPTIEIVGGGGIRCMMAGISLPEKA